MPTRRHRPPTHFQRASGTAPLPRSTPRRILLGTSLRVSYEGCCPRVLDDPAALKRHLRAISKLARLTVVRALAHRYRPYGVTVVLILKESHLVIHTWPEYEAAVLELFSCASRIPARRIAARMKRCLGAASQRASTAAIDIRGR